MNDLDLKNDLSRNIIREFLYKVKENNAAKIISYNAPKDNVSYVEVPKYIGTNPNSPKGYLVDEIADNAFNDCYRLKTVLLPNSIKIIGNNAFDNCRCLYKINTPTNLKIIGDYSFKSCKVLTNFQFSEQIESIGKYAFSNTGLTKFFSNKKLNFIGDYAFSNCIHLKSLSLKKSIKLNSISKSCFIGCKKLEHIRFNEELNYIGDGAFNQCTTLSSISLSKKITEINSEVFKNCFKLKCITITSKNFNRIHSNAFLGCNSLHMINFTNIIKKAVSVDINAFLNCGNKLFYKDNTHTFELTDLIKDNNIKKIKIK